MSQLALAVEAEISTRHLSFVETGRAQPSREMVLLLARVLDMPPRARNELLAAAGYAPIYRETKLEAPEMADVHRALDFILRQQEPYPGLVVDGHWNILMTNEANRRLMGLFLDAAAIAAVGGPPNALRLFYHPRGIRPFIVNWEPTAAALIQWLHRDMLLGIADAETRRLLEELLSYPDVPQKWRMLNLDASTAPFLAVELRKGDIHLKFFSTLTSLGVPYDITLHELRVECFFPADGPSEEMMRRLAWEPGPTADGGGAGRGLARREPVETSPSTRKFYLSRRARDARRGREGGKARGTGTAHNLPGNALMRRLLIVMAIALTLTACASSPSRPQRSEFEDIPVPAGLQLDLGKSTIIESPAVKAARLFYKGRLKPDSLALAFRTALEASGWRHLSSTTAASQGTTQVYEKPDSSLQVVIYEGWYYTWAEVSATRIIGQKQPPTR